MTGPSPSGDPTPVVGRLGSHELRCDGIWAWQMSHPHERAGLTYGRRSKLASACLGCKPSSVFLDEIATLLAFINSEMVVVGVDIAIFRFANENPEHSTGPAFLQNHVIPTSVGFNATVFAVIRLPRVETLARVSLNNDAVFLHDGGLFRGKRGLDMVVHPLITPLEPGTPSFRILVICAKIDALDRQ